MVKALYYLSLFFVGCYFTQLILTLTNVIPISLVTQPFGLLFASLYWGHLASDLRELM